MNILVYEHILGEDIYKNSPSSLQNEAKLIISNIIRDLSTNYRKSKITLLTNKKNKNFFKNILVLERNHNLDLIKDFKKYEKYYEKVLILAPEEDCILYEIIKELEENNIPHLNSSSKAIKMTTNKEATNKILKKFMKNTLIMHKDYKDISANESIVSKKIDGIGADHLFIFKNRSELEKNINKISEKHYYQKYKEGLVIGLNVFANEKNYKILSINEQVYQGKEKYEIYLKNIIIGKHNHLIKNFDIIVKNILENFNGLDGFFGIDFILSENDEIFFLEINPRLTTSFSFLHDSLGFNPFQFYNDFSFDFDIKNNKILSKSLII